MKIVRIFGESLWSVRWEGQRRDEFSLAFKNWQDIEYLESFFELHAQDLKHGYYRIGTVEEAVWMTLEEAKEMERRVLRLCKNMRQGQTPGVDAFFVPLSNQAYQRQQLSKRKGKGPRRNSWLRIYAIQIDAGCYLIVGSAIKLSRTMEERPHTLEQLKRLTLARDYLLREGVTDIGGFLEMQL